MKFKKKKLSFLVCGHLIGAIATPIYANDETPVKLNTIIVSAKAPVNEATFAGSVTVVSAEEIQASGATNINDVLETTPSIQMIVTGNSPSKAPQIRGQNADRALILVNGKRIPNTDRNVASSPAYRYGLVPLANVERIEIIRGPASSLYGADAMAGVINIITKKATNEWTGAVSVYSEQTDDVNGGDGKGVSFSASGSLSDNVDLLIAAESTSTDAILDDGLASLQSEKDLKNFQVDLGIDLNNNDRVEIGIISSNEEGTDFNKTGAKDTPIEVTNRIATIEYFTALAGFDTSLSVTSGNSDVLEGKGVWNVTEDNVALDLQGRLNEKHYLSYGVNYREEGVDRNDTTIFSDDVHATTLFVQDVFDVTKDGSLTLGLSYDMHSEYDAEASPKINWFTQLSPTVGFKVGYGESYLAPSIREGSSKYIVSAGPTRRYVGNDNLQPETAKTIESGLTFQHKNNSGSISLFRSDVDNLISVASTVSGGVTTAEYNNVDSALLKGLELAWSFYNDNKSQKLNLSYAFLHTEDLATGKELPDRAKHLAKLNYFHQSVFSGFDMDAAARFIGEQHTDDGRGNTGIIGSYVVADIGISKDIFENASLRFGINNMGNVVVLNGSDQLLETGRSFKLALTSTF
jgi:outer membrane receptor for ferrienterochelin and colicins